MNLSKKSIKAHGQGLEKLSNEQEDEYLKQINSWSINREKEPHILHKTFQFSSFKESVNFANKIAELAEKENHHPNILIYFKKVILEFKTNHLQCLTDNDFIMALKVDEII